MSRTTYPSDIDDAQWKVLEPLIPPAKPGGRPRTVDMREILNAIFYVVRSGCAWRMVPHDLPIWSTAYDYFRQFRNAGVWQHIHDTLRGQLRRQEGREESPSAAIIDSQSVKTTEKGGSVGMMPVRKSMAANAIWLWTLLDWCWPFVFTKPAFKIATAPSSYSNG
jgi:putative transposase